MLRYFYGSFFVTFFGLFLAAGVGFYYGGSWETALSAVFLSLILSVLEISLSFDNAVVNATVLEKMTPVWQHRFITWGILIAVFGMRLIFPLAVVSLVAHVNPWEALVLAATQPQKYEEIMVSSHLLLAGFGGAFLMMVALSYFFDDEKDVHWMRWIEKPLASIGRIQTIEIAVALIVFYVLSRFLPNQEAQLDFLVSGMLGLITFVVVDGMSAFLQLPSAVKKDIHRASMAMFVYLEILDASFSFDGVVGAFALTNNLFLIAIGLGIGAMFVRSMTILLVEKKTLSHFRYLEHGAFYAIGALALLMLIGAFVHVPEMLTGLIGAAFIGLSLLSSLRYERG
jgi:hypothetical protein